MSKKKAIKCILGVFGVITSYIMVFMAGHEAGRTKMLEENIKELNEVNSMFDDILKAIHGEES